MPVSVMVPNAADAYNNGLHIACDHFMCLSQPHKPLLLAVGKEEGGSLCTCLGRAPSHIGSEHACVAGEQQGSLPDMQPCAASRVFCMHAASCSVSPFRPSMIPLWQMLPHAAACHPSLQHVSPHRCADWMLSGKLKVNTVQHVFNVNGKLL